MASGKTTISNEICKKFPELNYVNADLFRAYFRENYSYFSDLDESYPTEKCTRLNTVVNPMRIDLLQILLEAETPILFNMSWLTQEKRKVILDIVPDDVYTKILVQTKIDETELMQRIIDRDNEHKASRNWKKFHQEMRKGLYEEISPHESEITYTYNQNNLDEIMSLITENI